MDEKMKIEKDSLTEVSGGSSGSDGGCRFTVNLSSERRCAEFVQTAKRCSGSVTLRQGSRQVDGRRILQVVSLDRSQPITVILSDADEADYFSSFR